MFPEFLRPVLSSEKDHTYPMKTQLRTDTRSDYTQAADAGDFTCVYVLATLLGFDVLSVSTAKSHKHHM